MRVRLIVHRRSVLIELPRLILRDSHEITPVFTTRRVSEGQHLIHEIPRFGNEEAVTKLVSRRVSEDCTESNSTSLTRRDTILAFGSVRLKESQPQRVRISFSANRESN